MGAVVGTVVGVLVGSSLGHVWERPSEVVLGGRLHVDSASHPDSRMDNRIMLAEAELEEPIYVTSETVDINDLYRLSGQSIRLRGEFRRVTLTSDESILELDVREVSTSTTHE
jgi:hypothetical protein